MFAGVAMPCRGGSSSGNRRSVMLRAWPGMRVMNPRRSSVRIIWCTLGGET
jgi:hypothetical protein